MKFPLITAALSTTYFLSSLPVTEAKAYYRYKGRPSCSDLGLCRSGGGNGAWITNNQGLSSFDRGTKNMLDNVMTEFFRVPISFNTLYGQSQRHLAETMSRSSIRYDVTDGEESMELTLDLPGVHANDVSVQLLHDGKAINIAGSRKYKQQGEIITSKFEQTFTIDDAVIDVDTIEANLSEGVLIVSARKKQPKALPNERKIPIGTTKGEVRNVTAGAGSGAHTEKAATGADVADDETRTEEATADDDLEISPEEDIE